MIVRRGRIYIIQSVSRISGEHDNFCPIRYFKGLFVFFLQIIVLLTRYDKHIFKFNFNHKEMEMKK